MIAETCNLRYDDLIGLEAKLSSGHSFVIFIISRLEDEKIFYDISR